jgi:hypothetical protein
MAGYPEIAESSAAVGIVFGPTAASRSLERSGISAHTFVRLKQQSLCRYFFAWL